MVEAESEVVLLPLFVFASKLRILMTHAEVRLCGGYILRPIHGVF